LNHCLPRHIYRFSQLIQSLFRIEKEEGPSHEREFVCSVQVETQSGISQMEIQDGISKKEVQNKIFITIGEPMSRVKDSENSAAQKMLEVLLNL
jgi:hypothetical protein